MRQIDGTTILYAMGALLGVAAIVYFGQEVLLSLSPTVKAALLFLTFMFFLVSGIAADRDTFNTVLLILAVGAYLVFLSYTVFRFNPSTNQIFVLLATSSALFIGIAYGLRERELAPSSEHVQYVIGALLVLAAVLIAADALGPQATVTTTFEDHVNMSHAPDGSVTIGVVRAENVFFLSRTVSLPAYTACFVTRNRTERRMLPVRVGDGFGGTQLLPGNGEQVEPVMVRVPVTGVQPERAGLPGLTTNPVPIRRVDTCPLTWDEPALLITTGTARDQ